MGDAQNSLGQQDFNGAEGANGGAGGTVKLPDASTLERARVILEETAPPRRATRPLRTGT